MKYLFIVLYLVSSHAFSINLKLIGACSDKPIYELDIQLKGFISLGEFTVRTFEQNSIPYIGNEIALNSILNFPTGLDALEVIDNHTMRAHGACYMVDGVIPEIFPANLVLGLENQSITWFIGYSTFIDGAWIGQCDFTSNIAPEQFCSNKNNL